MKHFDKISFERLQHELKSGFLQDNTVKAEIQPARISRSLCTASETELEVWRQLGIGALSRGEVACVILAGGMATRFGGVVKANVPVVQGHTFLEMKLNDVSKIQKKFDCKVPVWLMTSFATDEPIRAVLQHRPFAIDLDAKTFQQNVSYRMDRSGNTFHEQGVPSLYAPGHGDLPDAIQRDAGLCAWIERGGKWILMSNVDNVGATLDPAVIGAAIEAKTEMLVEVVKKYDGDKGGAAGLLEGRPQVIEAFRFPKEYDQDLLPHFNTNTMVFSAPKLLMHYPLSWFRVEKKIGKDTVVQFERLVGELTAFLRTEFLEVPREMRAGQHSRFIPIKEPQDLENRMKDLEAIWLGNKV